MAVRDVILRVPRTRQPQFPAPIDWNNPVTLGLQATFSPVMGVMFDTSLSGAVRSTVDTGTMQVSDPGVSRGYTAGQRSTFASSSRYGLTGAMTIVVIFDANTLTNYSALLSCQDTTTTNGWEFRLGASSGSSEVLMHRANAADYRQFATAANRFTAGSKNNFVAVTCAPTIETAPVVYANGILYNTASIAGAITGSPTASTSTLDIGARASGTTQLDGAVLFAALWSRALSAAEIESLRRNHAQVYQPAPRRMWATAAAPAGLSATPSAVATSAAALTTAITPAATSAAQASSSAALTTAITPANVSTAQATSTAALTTAITLSASSTAQATSTAGLTTTPAGLVATSAAVATSTAALTTAISLASAPAASATSTGALTTAIPLAASSAAQAASAATLTSAAAALAAISTAQATSTAALTTAITLAAAAVAQASSTAGLSSAARPPVPTGTTTRIMRVVELMRGVT